jgi:hypothetical protein
MHDPHNQKNFSGDGNFHAFANVIDREAHPVVEAAASPIRDRRCRLTVRDRPAY